MPRYDRTGDYLSESERRSLEDENLHGWGIQRIADYHRREPSEIEHFLAQINARRNRGYDKHIVPYDCEFVEPPKRELPIKPKTAVNPKRKKLLLL